MLGEQWQIQAQAALGQLERLKDMLAEGASWLRESEDEDAVAKHGPPDTATGSGTPRECEADVDSRPLASETAAQAAGSSATAGEVYGAGAAAPRRCASCVTREQHIAEQRVEIADLDLQMRALRAEVLRSTQLASQVGRSVLPALYSIESRLMEASS